MPEDFTQATIRNLSRAGEMSGPETRALTLLAQAIDQLNATLTAHIAECHHPALPIPRSRLCVCGLEQHTGGNLAVPALNIEHHEYAPRFFQEAQHGLPDILYR